MEDAVNVLVSIVVTSRSTLIFVVSFEPSDSSWTYKIRMYSVAYNRLLCNSQLFVREIQQRPHIAEEGLELLR